MFSSSRRSPTYIVGIGSSAGGLEALKLVVGHLPEDTQLAYLVAQHMAPQHRGMLSELLGKETSIPIDVAQDDGLIEPGHVYVCPPNADLTVNGERMRLTTPSQAIGPKPSIDTLFNSLASQRRALCAGIVLSGTGSDGAHGSRAIRAAGGLTIAQEPKTAQYDSMPLAAIALGGAELTMAPETIGPQLNALLERPRSDKSANRRIANLPEGPLDDIINGIWRRQGLDFSKYKDSTIARQIDRRIGALQLEGLDAYGAFVHEHPEELDALAKSFLISVTAFFRDTAAFEAINETIRGIVASKADGEEIRIWVPGVGTGEEAYSLAILAYEAVDGNTQRHPIQIFATDVDGDAIAHARKGYYPEASLEAMDPARIQRYFDATTTGYRIARRIQEIVIFARQDLVRDPPFLRLDLVSCRNVLIYFKPELQQHLFQVFHYALNPGAWLFLGSSEVIGSATNLFQQRHKTRIFQRNDLAPPPTPRLIQLQGRLNVSDMIKPTVRPTPDPKMLLREQLARTYAPPSVLLDADNQVVELFGETQAYFQLSEGSAQFGVLRIIRPDLRTELRALIHRVRQGSNDSAKGQEHYPEDSDVGYQLCVARVVGQGNEPLALLLSFDTVRRRPSERRLTPASETANTPGEAEERLSVLQDELSSTREHLQTVIEELETSNEELQSMNEELQASGEELQASNEELATSNEELQATNEELSTVNDELQAKTQEVVSTLEDLENIQDATSVAVVVLNKDLLITRFNALAVRHIGLTDPDLGRSLAALPIRLPQNDIQERLRKAIAGRPVEPFERDIGDRVYQIAIGPYLDDEATIQGAVLSMADITELKGRERALREANQLFETFAATDQAMIWVQEPQFGPIRYISPACQIVCGLDPQMVMRDPEYLFKVMHADDAQALRQAHFATKDRPWSVLTRIVHPRDGATHWLRTRAFPLLEDGRLHYVVGFTFDVTAEVEANRPGDLDLLGLFELLVDEASDGVVGFASDGSILFANGALEPLLDVERDALIGQDASAVLKAGERKRLMRLIDGAARQRLTLKRPMAAGDGAEATVPAGRPTEIVLSTEPLVRGGRAAAIALFRNPASQRHVLRELQIAHSVYRSTRDGLMVLDDETRIILTNPALRQILRRNEAELVGSVPNLFPGRSTDSAFNAEIEHELEQNGVWSGEVHAQVDNGDFVVLEVEVNQLQRASADDLGRYMLRVTDITRRRSDEDTIYRQANYDVLTGLPNRALLQDRLSQELRHAQREGLGLTLMFIDLDRFKEVNDSLGHEAGDELLVGVTNRIQTLVRASDTLSRFGGDEFVLLLPKYRREQGPELTAQAILKAFEQPFEIRGQEVFTSPSIGIVVFPQDGADASELLRNADAAMYESKRNGRSQFAFFQASMNADAAKRVRLETDLRRALDHGGLITYYQPVLSALSGTPCGVEALVRWLHEERGLLAPSNFIPYAEDSGLIVPVTRLVLVDALARLLHWREQIADDFQVAVNISPRLFRQTEISELFPESNPDLEGLVVEVTESLFLDVDEARVRKNLSWLKQRGARVALDDFGTGYSSLAYVRNFSVDIIKIDRAFIQGLSDQPRDLALVEAAVAMAHGVGALVTAEGIETEAQAQAVRRLGADHLQGFLFAKPMPPEEADAYLREQADQHGEERA